MSQVVPPRPAVEVREFTDVATARPEARAQWVAAVTALLPPHAHSGEGDTFRWSNAAGLWSLQMRPLAMRVVVAQGWGDGGHSWVVTDPHIDHVRSVLAVFGAIEDEP